MSKDNKMEENTSTGTTENEGKDTMPEVEEVIVGKLEEFLDIKTFKVHFKAFLRTEIQELYNVLELIENGVDTAIIFNILTHTTASRNLINAFAGKTEDDLTAELLIKIVKTKISDFEIVEVNDIGNMKISGLQILLNRSLTAMTRLILKLESLNIKIETVAPDTIALNDSGEVVIAMVKPEKVNSDAQAEPKTYDSEESDEGCCPKPNDVE